MRYGCCGCLVTKEPDTTGVDIIDDLVKIGYDYIELSLTHLMSLSESEFLDLKRRVDNSGIRCETCHNFFPLGMRLTGNKADMGRAMEYVKKALDRSSQLGTEVIVFGSAEAKNVPEGFPMEKAWDQIGNLLRNIDPLARKYGIIIGIEPINKSASNMINTAEEGLKLLQLVGRENIQLMVDYYHLRIEKESPDIILRAGEHIRHVHFAEVKGRTYPRMFEESYLQFFTNLTKARYQGRVSIEAYSGDFRKDATRSLSLLKEVEGRARALGP
jgi:sugar phosphate isomerase/epimerase